MESFFLFMYIKHTFHIFKIFTFIFWSFFGRSLPSYKYFSCNNFLCFFVVFVVFIFHCLFTEFRFKRRTPRELVTVMFSVGPKSGLFLTWKVFVFFSVN